MSDGEQEKPADLEGCAIEATAAEWFGRTQFWGWSQADQEQLEVWLEQSLSHKVAYWRLAAAWQRTERLNAIHAPQLARKHIYEESKANQVLRLAVGTAAVVAVAVIGSFILFQPKGQVYSTGIGETRTLALADGSRIELNTGTVLRLDVSKNSREASLEKGEAYFQIRHDPQHPFVVTAAGHRVTDIGTKFLVRDDAGQLEVTLVEGKARLEAASPKSPERSVVLTPGDVAVASESGLAIKKPPSQVVANALAWRTGVLVFDNDTLGDAAAEFNRYNQTKLVIGDPSIARMPVAGRFPTDGVDRFADVVQHVFGLHVRTESKEMIITR